MKTNTCKKHTNYGFTLVEISIVLMIIALLVAGVFSGQALVRNSKLQNVIKEIREYDAAITQFKTKFRYYPGDLPNAASYWGTYAAGPPATGTNNGNGNWEVGWAPDEEYYAWQHLYLAGILPNKYSGGSAGTPKLQYRVNIPGSAWSNTGYIFRYVGIYSSTRLGNAIELGTCSDYCNNGTFTSTQAYDIDKKIDDGLAYRGRLIGLSAAVSCIDAAWDSPTGGNYALSNTTPTCNMYYFLDQNW